MKILGIEKVSLVDFPSKICAVVFTSGCNMRCPFCHNSEIVYDTVNPIAEDDVIDYLISRKNVLDGVCVSGGEPTLQSDLIDFIRKIKGLGFAVKLDTNGTNPDVLQKLINANLLDYVAMDIKTCFDEYPHACGLNASVDNIKRSLDILHNSHVPYELRTTIVKEIHTLQSIEKLACDLDGEDILYLQHFRDNDTNIHPGLHEVSITLAEQYQQILSKHIKCVKLRGY